MSKDIKTLKERIIALVDERGKPYAIQLLNDLENATHEHSFESGYGIGDDVGWESSADLAYERGGYK